MAGGQRGGMSQLRLLPLGEVAAVMAARRRGTPSDDLERGCSAQGGWGNWGAAAMRLVTARCYLVWSVGALRPFPDSFPRLRVYSIMTVRRRLGFCLKKQRYKCRGYSPGVHGVTGAEGSADRSPTRTPNLANPAMSSAGSPTTSLSLPAA